MELIALGILAYFILFAIGICIGLNDAQDYGVDREGY